MKKKYVAPTMEIVEIEGEYVLAGSGGGYGSNSVGVNGDALFNDAVNAPQKKRTSIWDDED